jgi:hypothetical protein
MNPAEQINNFFRTYPAAFVALGIWTTIWKGLSLWKAAGKKEKIWFMALLALNTFGILEILYFFVLSKSERFSFNKKRK